ncbi:hypothetical protein DFP90_11314 [Aestuariispira insulae]|uniref:Uncharacterized protein n=1 Tax=Aestuariispira insulae TaxID=1461337 RepID=A0A3D9H5T9_9PROT|nr:hypothetical protein DFP90_11314 [Aestuariispira insulae]
MKMMGSGSLALMGAGILSFLESPSRTESRLNRFIRKGPTNRSNLNAYDGFATIGGLLAAITFGLLIWAFLAWFIFG